MRARLDSSFHRDVPDNTWGTVLDQRPCFPGPDDFLIRFDNGVEKWVTGYQVRTHTNVPDSRAPEDVEAWLTT